MAYLQCRLGSIRVRPYYIEGVRIDVGGLRIPFRTRGGAVCDIVRRRTMFFSFFLFLLFFPPLVGVVLLLAEIWISTRAPKKVLY